jgi:sugar/nucleoside kinase (ribokinase family)
VLVAGHACLDITPSLAEVRGELSRLIVPGKLVKVGPATVSTGGAVLNVGIPLKLLGVPTKLAGKIGDDELGRVLLSILSRYELGEGMIVARGQDTSYSIVISPPGVDRMFLHHPGANDTFVVDDMLGALEPPPAIVHFGYPPVMRRLYLDGGKELVRLLSTVGQMGAVVTLDTSFPDPASEAGRLDWHEILGAALPHVDAFMPSIEEALFLLDRARFDALDCASAEALFDRLGPDGVCEVCGTILDLGAAIAVVKCGGRGLCVRTGSGEVLAPIARRLGLGLGAWKERTLYAEALDVEVTGSATGAGDCAVAGFLAAMTRSEGLETAARIACAVGAQAVSAVNTVSAIRTYEETLEQLATCAYRSLASVPAGWRHLRVPGLWAPAD